MSILPKGVFLVLKTLTGLSDQKIGLVCGWWVSFSSAISMQTSWSRKEVRSGVYSAQPNVNNEEIQVMTKSGPRKNHNGQTTGINISIRVIVARSGLPAKIFLAFIVAVCIIAG